LDNFDSEADSEVTEVADSELYISTEIYCKKVITENFKNIA